MNLPKVETAADIVIAIGATLDPVAIDGITPGEETAVAGLLEAKRRAIETQ